MICCVVFASMALETHDSPSMPLILLNIWKKKKTVFSFLGQLAVETVCSLSIFFGFRGWQVVHFPLGTRSHCGPSRGRFLIISTPHIEFHGVALFMHWKGERKKNIHCALAI